MAGTGLGGGWKRARRWKSKGFAIGALKYQESNTRLVNKREGDGLASKRAAVLATKPEGDNCRGGDEVDKKEVRFLLSKRGRKGGGREQHLLVSRACPHYCRRSSSALARA